jgi:hypothetical protein
MANETAVGVNVELVPECTPRFLNERDGKSVIVLVNPRGGRR